MSEDKRAIVITVPLEEGLPQDVVLDFKMSLVGPKYVVDGLRKGPQTYAVVPPHQRCEPLGVAKNVYGMWKFIKTESDTVGAEFEAFIFLRRPNYDERSRVHACIRDQRDVYYWWQLPNLDGDS